MKKAYLIAISGITFGAIGFLAGNKGTATSLPEKAGISSALSTRSTFRKTNDKKIQSASSRHSAVANLNDRRPIYFYIIHINSKLA